MVDVTVSSADANFSKPSLLSVESLHSSMITVHRSQVLQAAVDKG